MWIYRDLLRSFDPYRGLEAAAILGARQVGKSSLMVKLGGETSSLIELDDLQVRTRAKVDPALTFSEKHHPILIDEFQYAPELLSEIKLQIDRCRRDSQQTELENSSPLFFLSGSNQIEIDKSLRETLAGRVSLFSLHGLSVNEIIQFDPTTPISKIFWKGGFPQLYTTPGLEPREYISDYISTFIEKDIARTAGITKLDQFLSVLQLISARVAEVINYASLAQDAGVAPKTATEWVSILERAGILETLPVYATNLNTRLIKAPKLFFLDSGLVTRLQGHLSENTILSVPQAGHIFENLVLSEVAKARDHLRLPIKLHYWRTKEGEEIDLIVESSTKQIFIESKLAIQNVQKIDFSSGIRKVFSGKLEGYVVTPGGTRQRLSEESEQLPIQQLGSVLSSIFSVKK
jgi:predicted AAA+ superfamily ATPase